jgi:formylglycine-generating enzyme required for sulfatase activity
MRAVVRACLPALLLALVGARAALGAAATEYRPTRFADWQRAHPNAEAEIAELKTKTAALVAPALARFVATTPAAQPAYPALRARSAALSAAARAASGLHFRAAYMSWVTGDCDAAESGFKSVLDADPVHAAANYYYGECLMRRNDREAAAEFVKRAILFADPSSNEALLARDAATRLPSPPATPYPPDPRVNEPPRIFRIAGAIDTVVDCATCPELAIVPAGEFTMGAPPEARTGFDPEPQHRVFIAYPLAVAKTPVTFDQWQDCIADGGCNGYVPNDGPGEEHWGRGNRPVINVNFADAEGYIAWLTRKTGKPYRLLTEAEFEYAQRGGTVTNFYWGDAPSRAFANYGTDSCCGPFADGKDQWPNTSPVGSFPANPFGLYDMAGNVFQWTMGCWKNVYEPGTPVDGSPWFAGDCTRRPLRGGAWYDDASYLRSSHRHTHTAAPRSGVDGFRVARWL